jgi:hypothetical protein
MNITRRQLCWSSAAAALAMTLPSRRRVARADVSPTKKNLIIVLAFGGWDTAYAVDPKPPGGGVDVPAGTIVTHGGIDVLEDATRPSIGGFFTKYASISAIVRGIRLPGISHRACMQQILTGQRNETSPDAAAIVAQHNSPELPIPYLVLGDYAFAGPYAASMGRVGARNQLVGVLDPRAEYALDDRPPLTFTPNRADEDAIRAYTLARSDRERATKGATGYNKARIDDFVTSLDRGDRLRDPTIRDALGVRGTQLDLDHQRGLAVQAIATGLSRTIMLSSQRYWDTHEKNIDQSDSHEFLFDNLTKLVDDLANTQVSAGTTMLDQTVVAVISEMGRTPKLNGANGKDHWPVTSAMVIGGGVKGNRVYGGTSATGEAQLCDFATGDVSPSGRTIEPRHFVAGLVSLCGVDPTNEILGAEAFDAFIA